MVTFTDDVKDLDELATKAGESTVGDKADKVREAAQFLHNITQSESSKVGISFDDMIKLVTLYQEWSKRASEIAGELPSSSDRQHKAAQSDSKTDVRCQSEPPVCKPKPLDRDVTSGASMGYDEFVDTLRDDFTDIYGDNFRWMARAADAFVKQLPSGVEFSSFVIDKVEFSETTESSCHTKIELSFNTEWGR